MPENDDLPQKEKEICERFEECLNEIYNNMHVQPPIAYRIDYSSYMRKLLDKKDKILMEIYNSKLLRPRFNDFNKQFDDALTQLANSQKKANFKQLLGRALFGFWFTWPFR